VEDTKKGFFGEKRHGNWDELNVEEKFCWVWELGEGYGSRLERRVEGVWGELYLRVICCGLGLVLKIYWQKETLKLNHKNRSSQSWL
jgi:hypothetical protein